MSAHDMTPASAREVFAALPHLLTDPYIPEIHGDLDDEVVAHVVTDASDCPGCDAVGDTTRAAVLREVQDATVAWLARKAGEERSVAMQEEKRRATARARRHRERAELISTLASKVDRGAVRAFADAAPPQPTRADVLREVEARLLLHAERLESAVWTAAARVVANMADEADTAGGAR